MEEYLGSTGVTYCLSLILLRGLDFSNVTNVTAKDILNFIIRLGSGNKGLLLAFSDTNIDIITLAESKLIEERLAEKVKESLEYNRGSHIGAHWQGLERR